MKAIVYHRYGSPDVLEVQEVEKPTSGDNEVLIQMRASSVNPLDWHFMRGEPYEMRLMTGLRKPKTERLGVDVAGQVESVGKNVTQFKPGDEVFGGGRATFAEYACASESGVAMKPESITFEQAASINVAALTALQGLRDKGKIHAGQRVLINGAAGGVGTFAVQIAKSFGAEVTGVCSTRNVEMVRSIGADGVIDYTREDFTTEGPRYDLIYDCIGNHPLPALRGALNPTGTYIGVGGPPGRWMIGAMAGVAKMVVLSRFVSQNLMVMLAKASQKDLTIVGQLIEAEKVKPVIDRRYGLREVPEAIRYLETGHARGKVIITLDNVDRSPVVTNVGVSQPRGGVLRNVIPDRFRGEVEVRVPSAFSAASFAPAGGR